MKRTIKLFSLVFLLVFIFSSWDVKPARAATLIVTNTADTNDGVCDADCSLREAIVAAASNDTIVFASALSGQTITLGSTLTINKNLTIDGSSLASQVTVSGGGSTGMFAIYYADIDVTFNNMTFTGANASQDPFGFTGDGRGGAFHNAGHLTINNSTIFNNAASFAGGAIYNDFYHSVANGGTGPTPTLNINNSTFHNNTTTRFGGAVMNEFGQMTISNSTFYQNSATFNGNGGAIMNQFGVSPSGIYNSTIANNTASSVGGGVWLNGNSSISFNLNNVILANNIAPADADCWKAGSSILNGNRNIIETGSCPGPTNTITSDPNLGPLANNGGPTQTMALLSGSPALDAGDDGVCAAAPVSNLDQRGITRPFGSHCDIGAFEYYVPPVIPGAAGGLGPGGVGHTDGSSVLELWLRADREIFSNVGCTTPGTDGNTVACWQDQSGNNFDFTNSLANPPTYELTETGINSQPSLQFANDRLVYTNFPALTGVNDYAIYGVSLHGAIGQSLIGGVQTGGSGHGVQIASWSGNNVRFLHRMPFGGSGGNDLIMTNNAYTANTPHIVTAIRNRSSNIQSARVDGGTLQSIATSATVYSSNLDIAVGNRSGGANTGHALAGYIGEVIIFSEAPADVRRLLVENYLSSKFNITIPPASDFYDGDTAGNGNFDLDMAGIGQFGGNQHTQAHTAGMIVANNNFLNDNGDWLLFGHRTPVNSNSTADLPTGGAWDGINDVRWARHWYIDVTDAAGVNCATPGTCFVDIIFDFSEAGMVSVPNAPVSNYRLLKRTLATGPFTDIATATAVTGDQVQFLNVDVSLLGSNFTLGSIDGAASPTAITMHPVASSISQPGYPLLIAVLLVLLLAGTMVVWRRRA